MPLRMNAMPLCLKCPLQAIPPTLVESTSAISSFRNCLLNNTFLSYFLRLENNEAILQQSSTILGSAGATKNGGQRTAVQTFNFQLRPDNCVSVFSPPYSPPYRFPFQWLQVPFTMPTSIHPPALQVCRFPSCENKVLIHYRQ